MLGNKVNNQSPYKISSKLRSQIENLNLRQSDEDQPLSNEETTKANELVSAITM